MCGGLAERRRRRSGAGRPKRNLSLEGIGNRIAGVHHRMQQAGKRLLAKPRLI